MITAVRAFDLAHGAIAGKSCHNAACDVAIEREDDTYVVSFSHPGDGAGTGAVGSTRVVVDGSGAVRDVRDVGDAEPNARPAGMISARRAFEIGLEALRESGVESDQRWTTAIKLAGDRYHIIFPLPEAGRNAPLRADYALLVAVDARTGKVIELLGGS